MKENEYLPPCGEKENIFKKKKEEEDNNVNALFFFSRIIFTQKCVYWNYLIFYII